MNDLPAAQTRYRATRNTFRMNAVGCGVLLAFATAATVFGKPGAGRPGFALGSVYVCFTVVAYFRMRRARERASPVALFPAGPK